jgi:hypothetical protein
MQRHLQKGQEARPHIKATLALASTHRSIAAAITNTVLAHHLCMTRTRTERGVLFVQALSLSAQVASCAVLCLTPNP